MGRTAISLVDDTGHIEEIEIENTKEILSDTKIIKHETDPFKNVPIGPQSQKIKGRYYRLKKKNEGTDGTESKYNDPLAVNAYGLFDTIEPPFSFELLAQLYTENATHNAAINARVMATVGLGYKWTHTMKAKQKIEKATAKAGNESEDRARLELQKEEQMIEEIFDSFHEEETFIETLMKIWLDVRATGNGFMEIGRNRSGKIGYVGHIPSPLIRVRRKRDGFVQLQVSNQKAVFFRNFQDKETADPINDDPNPNEIIHFKSYSPTNNWYGVPDCISALTAIIGDKFAKEYNIDYFENKSVPRYAIILKGAKLSNAAKKNLVQYFRHEVKGNNHGTLIIPLPSSIGHEADIKFEKLEDGIQDASFDKYRKSNRDDIVIAHRVPPTKIGIYESSNLAVSRDADKTFKTQVVGPDQTVIERRINRLVKEFTDFLQFELDQMDIIDDDLRSKINDRYLRDGVITRNEVREDMGLPAIGGLSEPLTYPANTKQQELEWKIADKAKMDKKQEAAGLVPGAKGAPGTPGAPPGNANAISGSPEKGQQDAANKPSSGSVDAGTNLERGAQQDQGKGSNK